MQIPAPLRVRAVESRPAHPLRRRELRAEVARRVTRGAFRVRQPERLLFGRHAHGHDARAISALELRLHLGQPAVERQHEARRLWLQGEFINAKVRIHFTFGFQHGQLLAQKQRHARPRQLHGRAEQLAPLDRQPDWFECVSAKRP